jgi:uncharacterized protein YqfA (UPF0365 family)
MDYYRLKNIQADTEMRSSIGGGNVESGPDQATSNLQSPK